MAATDPGPLEITPQARIAARSSGHGRKVMYQQWRNLLFLHWSYDATLIQSTLPDGLKVDTYDNRAYVGIVPFFMQNIRPRFLPAVAGISNFLELNVRTYVYDRDGIPGVWFYSLDANQPLAVMLARTLFHLPYEYARMTATENDRGEIEYSSQRRKSSSGTPFTCFRYTIERELPPPEPESLEFFLLERYQLYAKAGKNLNRGAVGHSPYPVCNHDVAQWDDSMLTLNGFPKPNRPPDHVAASTGVDVEVFQLEKLTSWK